MGMLILGLVIFLGIHSVRVFADSWRTRQRERLGEAAWKGLYSVASIIGFALIVWGYGLARANPVDLWSPPIWTRHLASLLMLPSMVLLAAAYVPGNRIRRLAGGHPMLVATKLWAFAHLAANGRLADLMLFGGFLVWAALAFRACRARDRAAGVTAKAGTLPADLIVLLVGLVAWAAFAFKLHALLIGVAPMG
jgi:uncharacterized membrane protein